MPQTSPSGSRVTLTSALRKLIAGDGAEWTLVDSVPPGNPQAHRNGIPQFAWGHEMRMCGGELCVGENDVWWVWDSRGTPPHLVFMGNGSIACPALPDPVVTPTVPHQDPITDLLNNVWTLGDEARVRRNGLHFGNGLGWKLILHTGYVYVFGTDGNWYKPIGDYWTPRYEFIGPTAPDGSVNPPLPPPPPVHLLSLLGARIAVSDDNTATPTLIGAAYPSVEGEEIPNEAYEWQILDGVETIVATHLGKVWKPSLAPGKTYTVRMGVWNGSAQSIVNVLLPTNQVPVSRFHATFVGRTVTFTSDSWDPDGDVINEQWILPSLPIDAPNGTGNIQDDAPVFATGKTAVKTYSAPDRYWVRLRVTDSKGAKHEPIQMITIAAAGNPLGLTPVDLANQ